MPKTIENLKLGLALFQKGKVAEAEKYFRSVLELSPNNPHALNLLGLLCVNTKRAAEAIDCLSQALEVNAQDHQACANLGLAYQQLGQLTQACHYLQRAAQLAPIDFSGPVRINRPEVGIDVTPTLHGRLFNPASFASKRCSHTSSSHAVCRCE